MTLSLPKLNILILSQHAGGDKYGMVHRNFAFAKQWQAMGHQVTILSAAYSHTRQQQPKVSHWVNLEMLDGIQFIWLKGNTYRAKSQLGRVISMALFNVQAWFGAAKYSAYSPQNTGQAFDIVIASAPNPFCIFPAYHIARKNNAKLIFEVRDLWPKTLIELGNLSPKHPFIRLMQYAEDFACQKADSVIGVSANAQDYLISRGMTAENFICIPNGISSDISQHAQLPPSHQHALQQLRHTCTRVIGYCGALGLANGLHLLLKALKQSESRVGIAIMGQGEYKAALEQQIQQLNLQQRVTLLPPVNRDQVADFLSYVDITYLGLRTAGDYTLGVSPTKLADYLKAAKPVIYAIGDQDNAIAQSGCGIECQPGNVHHIAQAINTLSSCSNNELTQMGSAGRMWMQTHLNLERLADKAILHFYQLLSLDDRYDHQGQS